MVYVLTGQEKLTLVTDFLRGLTVTGKVVDVGGNAVSFLFLKRPFLTPQSTQ